MFEQQHKGVTEIEALEPDGKKTASCKRSFVGLILFLFPETVNLCAHSQDSAALCLHSAGVWFDVFIFFFSV